MRPILIAECFFDTLIIEILTGEFRWKLDREFWHEAGTKVLVTMEKRANNDKGLTVGFFDKNKKIQEHKHVRNFKVDQEIEGIQWLKASAFPDQHILYLKDGAEEWFLETAKSAFVSPLTYSIPEKPKDFKERTKILSIRGDIDMYRFIKAVIKENPPQIQTLREYISAIFGEQIHSLSTE